MSIKNQFILGLSLLLVACTSPTRQPQRSFFPIPCESRAAGIYYVDENGEKMTGLNEALKNYRWRPDVESMFFHDDLLRIDGRYFLDRDGQLVLDVDKVAEELHLRWAKCSDFSEGVAFIQGGSLADVHKSFAIDKNGKLLFELEGKPLTAFYKGFAYFETSDKEIGIVNSKGEIIVEPREDISIAYSTYPFMVPPINGKISVKNDKGLIGAINFKGDLLVDYISLKPLVFDNNNCAVFRDENGKYGLVNSKGKIMIEPVYSALINDGKWYYYEMRDEEFGWADKRGIIGKGWCDKKGVIKMELLPHTRARREGPYLFYGSPYSVELEYNDSFGDSKYFTSLHDESDLGIANGFGYWLASPFVNDVAVAYIPNESTFTLVRRNGMFLERVNDNYFAGVWSPKSDFEMVGDYVVHPWALWHGADD